MTPRTWLPVLFASLTAACGGASEDYEPPQIPPPPTAVPAGAAAQDPEPYTTAAPPPPAAPAPPAPPAQASAPPPPAPPAAPVAPAAPAAPAAPDQGQVVYSYPTGQWVYVSGQGWTWIPSGATTTEVEGVPYTYMYTPSYGWTWYVSPWGAGPYHYGVWIRHPWHPVGWHGRWVARPAVVVHLGARPHYYRARRW